MEGEIQSMRGIQTSISGFKDGRRGPGAMEYAWPLEAGNGPQLIASKEAGISVLLLQETKFCQNNE